MDEKLSKQVDEDFDLIIKSESPHEFFKVADLFSVLNLTIKMDYENKLMVFLACLCC